MKTCAESGHPVFWCLRPLSRGALKSKGNGRCSIHIPCESAESGTFVENKDRRHSSASAEQWRSGATTNFCPKRSSLRNCAARARVKVHKARHSGFAKLSTERPAVVTKQHGRHIFEVKIDSSAKDGSTSMAVISRSVERYLTELSMECTEAMKVHTGTPSMMRQTRCVHNISCAVKLLILQQKEVTKLFSSIKRRWQHIPCVDKVLSQCLPISKRMVVLLRHSPHFRKRDGAVLLGRIDETCQWISRSGRQLDLRPMDRLFDERYGQNSFRVSEPSNKIHSRSFLRSSHRRKIVKKSAKSFGWTDYICHVGSSWNGRSTAESRLLAGIATHVIPLCNSILTPRVETGKPRMLPYRLK